jgi:hypothetical protein
VSLLLRLSGEPGLRVLGVPDRAWPALDLRRALAALVFVMAVPQDVGGWLLRLLHLSGIGVTETHLPPVYVWPELVGAVNAGVVEEIAVLGFLVHRTRQRGWLRPPAVISQISFSRSPKLARPRLVVKAMVVPSRE